MLSKLCTHLSDTDKVICQAKLRKKKLRSKLKINLRWLHFGPNKGEFVTVCSSKGGDIREEASPLVTNKDAIIEACQTFSVSYQA